MSVLEEATEVKGQYGASQIQVLEGLKRYASAEYVYWQHFRQGPAPSGV